MVPSPSAPINEVYQGNGFNMIQLETDTPINQEMQSQPASPVIHPSSESLLEAIPSEEGLLDEKQPSHPDLQFSNSSSTLSQEIKAPSMSPPPHSSQQKSGKSGQSHVMQRNLKRRPPRLDVQAALAVETAPERLSSPPSTAGSETPRATPGFAVHEKFFPREIVVNDKSVERYQSSNRTKTKPAVNRATPSPPYFSPQTPVAMIAECPFILLSSPVARHQPQDDEDIWAVALNARSKAQLVPPSRPRIRARSHSPPPSAHPDADALSMRKFMVSNSPTRLRLSMGTPSLDTRGRTKGYVPPLTSANGKHAIIQSYFPTHEI
jgi:hypothetical protein